MFTMNPGVYYGAREFYYGAREVYYGAWEVSKLNKASKMKQSDWSIKAMYILMIMRHFSQMIHVGNIKGVAWKYIRKI